MRPSCTPNNVPDGSVVNAVFARQGALGNLPRCISSADCPDLVWVQHGRPVLLAPPCRNNDTSFAGRIPHVVCLCSEKEVSRITTGRIVATMKNGKAGRNWACGNSPRYTMGTEHQPCQPQLSVAVGDFARLPFPASVGMLDVDPLPESKNVLLTQRRDAKMLPSHDSLLTRGLWSERSVAHAAGRSFQYHTSTNTVCCQ